MHASRFPLASALPLALFAVGCASGTPGHDKKDSGTSCNDNNDCRPGYVCVGHVCTLSGGDGGGIPAIQVQPRSLIFDQAVIGSPQTLTVNVTNVGSGTLNLTSTTLSEADAIEEYSFVEPSRTALAPNEGVVIQVTLDPTDTLLDTGTLTIESNDASSPAVTVALSSASIGDPNLKLCVETEQPPPDDCVDPAVIDYGAVTYGAVAQAGFYLANVGTGNKTITVSEVRVTSSSPSHGALFEIELFTMVETPPGSEVFVETPATLPVDLSPTLGGDPDPLALYGRLSFTANTDGFLILTGDSLTAVTSDVDDPTPRESAVPITATINGCPAGLQDLNGIPDDGCEYACSVTNDGVEACDGLDNDCDGIVDGHARLCYEAADGGCNPDGTGCRGICQAGSQTCSNAVWSSCEGQVSAQPEACDTLDNDCNGLVNDGLDEGGNSCGPTGSITLPSRPENGTSGTVTGTITQGDEDWYAITFTDTAGYPNGFNMRISITDPPAGGNFRMDILKGNCTTPVVCGTGSNVGIVSFSWNAFGEASAACTGGTLPCPASHTQTLYVRVYKLGGPICESYTITATNG